MPKAVWKGATLAESGETVMVREITISPPESVDSSFFEDSTSHTRCHWKGDASYYDVVVNGEGKPIATGLGTTPTRLRQPARSRTM